MPIYEYECQVCNKVHEIMQKFSDKPIKKCPDCGKPVKKLMSLSSFSLKGSGWYTTDYKRAKEKDGEKDGDKDGAKETEKEQAKKELSEPKSDAKPDAKSDATPNAKSDAKSDAKPNAGESVSPKTEKSTQGHKKN